MRKDMLLARMRGMMEANMASLSAPVDDGRRDRARGVVHNLRNLTRNSEGHAVLVWETTTEGSGHRHKCYIAIEPDGATMFQLAHASTKLHDAMRLLRDADVKCFCTCKDFKFSGAEYNLKHRHGSLEVDHSSRKSSDMVPSVRDPNGEHTLCKHLYSCFNGILTNAASIMSRARKANFPTKSPEPANTTVVGNGGKSDSGTATGGDMVTMNGGARPDTSTTGKITTLNGGKAIAENPGDAKAITILGNSTPVNDVPEVSEALDALAGSIMPSGQPDGGAGDADQQLIGVGSDKPSGGDDTITMLNSGDDTDGDGIFSLEDSISSDMFNQEADDELI